MNSNGILVRLYVNSYKRSFYIYLFLETSIVMTDEKQ